MQDYKRLKPFNKGILNIKKLIRQEERTVQATESGYTLLHGLNTEYGVYIHTACGAVSPKQYAHMRNKNVKCRVCMFDKFRKEASSNGYTFIEQIPPGDEGIYLCNKCNQQSTFQIGHVRAGNAKCRYCMIEVWKGEASSKGFTWLEQVNKDSSIYRHDACGRKLEIRMASIPEKCRYCQEDRYKSDAIRQGYEWVRRYRHVKSLYIHTPCGNAQTKALDDMRRGNICCVFCGDNWYTKKSNIYLLKITNDNLSWLKLGISKDTEKRSKGYGLKDDCKTEVLFTKEFRSGKEAVTVENYLHSKYKSHNLNSESMKNLMENGFTECYCLSVEHEILMDLNALGVTA